jgi:hypothetical protein
MPTNLYLTLLRVPIFKPKLLQQQTPQEFPAAQSAVAAQMSPTLRNFNTILQQKSS